MVVVIYILSKLFLSFGKRVYQSRFLVVGFLLTIFKRGFDLPYGLA